MKHLIFQAENASESWRPHGHWFSEPLLARPPTREPDIKETDDEHVAVAIAKLGEFSLDSVAA